MMNPPQPDYLFLQSATGESIPVSAEMISVELTGQTPEWLDPEFIQHAAKAVFHYFKHELRRRTMSLGEFAGGLEKVLAGLGQAVRVPAAVPPEARVLESDLHQLVIESGSSGELLFFPRLREDLRRHLA